MSDDTPTTKLPLPPSAGPWRPRPAPGRSWGPIITFIVLGLLVVAAIVVLIVILVGRSASANGSSLQSPPATSASATPPPSSPSATPTPTQTPTTPPALAGTFTSFVVPQTQQCGFFGSPGHTQASIQVSWSTADATQVWIAQGTGDAVTANFMEIPLSGNQNNFPHPIEANCSSKFNTYTMTLVGDDGVHVSKSWTVRSSGHHR